MPGWRLQATLNFAKSKKSVVSSEAGPFNKQRQTLRKKSHMPTLTPTTQRPRPLDGHAERTRPSARGGGLRIPTLSELPEYAVQLCQSAAEKFKSLPIQGKVVVLVALAVQCIAIITFMRIGTQGVMNYLYDAAIWFSSWPTMGPILLIGLITILSFPPLFGYGTSITLCGLAYGTPLPEVQGHGLFFAWSLAAMGCLTGSTVVFLFFRWYLESHRLLTTEDNDSQSPSISISKEWLASLRKKREWQAMEKAISKKGWKMIILIRFCPFPFVYSNLFFASLQSSIIPYRYFILATVLTTPKLFLHVFIGAQTFQVIQANRSNTGDGGVVDAGQGHSLISLIYIVLASLVGFVTSWYIYQETKKVLQGFIDDDDQDELEEGLLDHSNVREGQSEPQQESWGWSDDEEQETSNHTGPSRSR
ncbi:unnamed protein product [Sympodiomycopsis kandeliae]